MRLVDQNYGNYYEGDAKKAWYELSAVIKAENILEYCSGINVTSVLDIGAGSGAVLNRLIDGRLAESSGQPGRYAAAEISSSGIETMRKRFEGRPNVSVHPFDGRTLPFPDDSFDLAILSHVVEHVEHPRAALYEARRVAKHVYVEVPLEATFFIQRQRGNFVWDDTGHINYYNRHTFRRLLQTAGLKVDREGVVNASTAAGLAFWGGRWPKLRYHIRNTTHKLFPGIAQSLFVYHGVALCSRADKLPIAL